MRIQGAVAVHDRRVPGLLADHIPLVFQMPVESCAGLRFKIDLVAQPGLGGEGFEQSWHAADALAIQVGDRVGPIEAHRRAGAECEAVADEEDAAGDGVARAQEQGQRNAGKTGNHEPSVSLS